ncbi:exopolysaccharide biosynthesis protein, sugar transferase [Xenorhabdus stockiae]|uniref:Exopolysaccharide biosynthesis protein, sugar transferase n=1 Tax=Xenorhabdus stockiae TaxID=351614 RepID=A0A2D0KLE2_9GAMM|nr:glycosyltransferase family 2 protein [Xenorhabdus stockiae]PHM64259.1 exopolysaccharide biosynthesis protein, sugar transferase [Xenorhabdus stockiae]
MVPILSIIITAHNFENFINNCLISIKRCIDFNENRAIEIILIDDKSNDKTSKVMMDFANSENNNAKYFRTEFGNIGKVRNFSILNSFGKYITFIDGDDVIPLFDLDTVLDFLVSNEVDILISKINDVYKDSDYIAQSNFILPLKLTQNEAVREFLKHKKFQAHLCGKFFNRRLFDCIKIPEVVCYEDALIFPDILVISKDIFITKSVFYNYIKRIGSLSNDINPDKANIMADAIIHMNNVFGEKYKNIITTHAVEHLLKNKRLLSGERMNYLKYMIKSVNKISYFLDPSVRFSFKRKILKL